MKFRLCKDSGELSYSIKATSGHPISSPSPSVQEPSHQHGHTTQSPYPLDLSLKLGTFLKWPVQIIKRDVIISQPHLPDSQRSYQARTPSWGPQNLLHNSANAWRNPAVQCSASGRPEKGNECFALLLNRHNWRVGKQWSCFPGGSGRRVETMNLYMHWFPKMVHLHFLETNFIYILVYWLYCLLH